MRMIILIVLVCLSIAACNSSSPLSEQRRAVKEIQKEQERESREFDRFVERNPNVVPRNEDSNRLLTGEEQSEILNRVASGQSPEEIARAKSSGNSSNGRVSDNGYSIKFPDGWKVDKIKVDGHKGVQATSVNGTQIVTSAAKQDMGNFVATEEFATNFAYRVTLRLGQQMCSESRILKAYATTFQGHEGIYNKMKCDDNIIETMYIVHNGITYNLTSSHNGYDKVDVDELNKSICTYKIGS